MDEFYPGCRPVGKTAGKQAEAAQMMVANEQTLREIVRHHDSERGVREKDLKEVQDEAKEAADEWKMLQKAEGDAYSFLRRVDDAHNVATAAATDQLESQIKRLRKMIKKGFRENQALQQQIESLHDAPPKRSEEDSTALTQMARGMDILESRVNHAALLWRQADWDRVQESEDAFEQCRIAYLSGVDVIQDFLDSPFDAFEDSGIELIQPDWPVVDIEQSTTEWLIIEYNKRIDELREGDSRRKSLTKKVSGSEAALNLVKRITSPIQSFPHSLDIFQTLLRDGTIDPNLELFQVDNAELPELPRVPFAGAGDLFDKVVNDLRTAQTAEQSLRSTNDNLVETQQRLCDLLLQGTLGDAPDRLSDLSVHMTVPDMQEYEELGALDVSALQGTISNHTGLVLSELLSQVSNSQSANGLLDGQITSLQNNNSRLGKQNSNLFRIQTALCQHVSHGTFGAPPFVLDLSKFDLELPELDVFETGDETLLPGFKDIGTDTIQSLLSTVVEAAEKVESRREAAQTKVDSLNDNQRFLCKFLRYSTQSDAIVVFEFQESEPQEPDTPLLDGVEPLNVPKFNDTPNTLAGDVVNELVSQLESAQANSSALSSRHQYLCDMVKSHCFGNPTTALILRLEGFPDIELPVLEAFDESFRGPLPMPQFSRADAIIEQADQTMGQYIDSSPDWATKCNSLVQDYQDTWVAQLQVDDQAFTNTSAAMNDALDDLERQFDAMADMDSDPPGVLNVATVFSTKVLDQALELSATAFEQRPQLERDSQREKSSAVSTQSLLVSLCDAEQLKTRDGLLEDYLAQADSALTIPEVYHEDSCGDLPSLQDDQAATLLSRTVGNFE
ncbi:hypothetical protein HDK64DRAFT_341971 [Phyllosticta capitalensis]